MDLHRVLEAYVAEKESNGIVQHTQKWLDEKAFTVGGSSIAVFTGTSAFSSVRRLLEEKVGFSKFIPDIKPQWGNLFEEIIKRVCEYHYSTVILGEDLFIRGPGDTSYSPDGLGVMRLAPDEPEQIVLVEFKCPYSRIPDGEPPKYYIPQVKMGLDIIDIATEGLFAEAVFRRCAWDDLHGAGHDLTLVSVPRDGRAIAYGFVGFSSNQWKPTADYMREYTPDEPAGFSDETVHERVVNDLGLASPGLLKYIIGRGDEGAFDIWYSEVVFVDRDQATAQDIIDASLCNYADMLEKTGKYSIGILPWKLLQIDYHRIKKTPGYITPYLGEISRMIECARKCAGEPDPTKKYEMFAEFFGQKVQKIFSDE